MKSKLVFSILLSLLLVFLPAALSSQVDPGYGACRILEILDPSGLRLGLIVVAGKSGRGFEAGHEYWSFSEEALLGVAELESLELANLAIGEWDDPWVVEALRWQPAAGSVDWSHPTEVEWTDQRDEWPPVVPGGVHFGHVTLGGLTIQYSEQGAASLTWFKTTSGAFMQLEDGAIFTRGAPEPTTGSWWQGAI